jgi:hypothetical protein
MVTLVSFHKTESNRYYSGGHYRQDTSRPDNEVIFSHPTLSEPLCGWDWYKAHYNAEISEQSIEISFDNKILATITDWGYKKGMSKAIIDAEIAKHPSDFYKHKGKWNWLYIADKTEQKQSDIVLYGRTFDNPIIAQCTAIIEDMTFADMTVCVG